MLAKKLLVVLISITAPFASIASADEQVPVEAFARLPHVWSVRLSPNGQNIAYLANNPVGTFLFTQNIADGTRKPILRSENEEGTIAWFAWANDDLILVGATYPRIRNSVEVRETRLVGVQREGREPRFFLRPRTGGHRSQIADNVIDLLPDDPDHVLVALDSENPNYPTVFRLNLKSGKRKQVQSSRRPIRDWITDRQGRVRIGVGYNRGVVSAIARQADKKKWTKLWEYDAVAEPGATALGFGTDPNTLFIRAPHDGRDALFSLDLESGVRSLLLHDPNYDVQGNLIHARSSGDVIGVYHEGEDGANVYWDETYRALQQAIDQGLPDTTNSLIDFSRDERRYIVFASSDTSPGRYYYGDRESQALTVFAETYPELAEYTLSGKEWLTYEARDGLTIEGYLTRPWGDVSPPWPTVILPHGGPSARDYEDFDYMTEFLASRGYAVLQMNFRGSAGYGWEFLRSAVRDFGGEMQNDVTDGAQWMIDQELADPEHICIMGGSYGGYAALWGSVKTPDLYRCAISINGVSDWRLVLAESQNFVNSETIESQLGKRSELKQVSALRRAEEIQIPILLVHGEQDRVVPVDHSRKMAKALKKHGKVYTYLELEHGVHSLTNATNRAACLRAVDEFLATHLAPVSDEEEIIALRPGLRLEAR